MLRIWHCKFATDSEWIRHHKGLVIKMRQRALTEDTLQDIVGRIVEVADPDRIILFGSAARGEMDENSDVDLLVVKGGDYDYYLLLRAIYRGLRGADEAVDVVLVTPEQMERYRDNHYLIIAPALRDGKEVYRASEIPA